MTIEQFICLVQDICTEGYGYSEAIEAAIQKLNMTDKEFQDVILRGKC